MRGSCLFNRAYSTTGIKSKYRPKLEENVAKAPPYASAQVQSKESELERSLAGIPAEQKLLSGWGIYKLTRMKKYVICFHLQLPKQQNLKKHNVRLLPPPELVSMEKE